MSTLLASLLLAAAVLFPGSSATATAASTASTLAFAAAIQATVAAARPGDDLVVAGGTYHLSLDIGRVSGTAERPIRLRPAPGAVVTFVAVSGYALYVHNASHWEIGSPDGQLRFDGGGHALAVVVFGLYSGTAATTKNPDSGPAHHIGLRNAVVTRAGQALVRIRSSSTNIDLVDSELSASGMRTAGYGEGVYVGSATGPTAPGRSARPASGSTI